MQLKSKKIIVKEKNKNPRGRKSMEKQAILSIQSNIQSNVTYTIGAHTGCL